MAGRKKKAARKTRTPRGGVNKVEFVRNLPAGASWVDAEAKAKEAGIVLSKAYYYVIKSSLKKAAGGAPKGRPGRKPGRPGRKASSGGGLMLTSTNSDETVLINAVRTLGVQRARAIIDVAERFEQ